jgi:hypothetical protein
LVAGGQKLLQLRRHGASVKGGVESPVIDMWASSVTGGKPRLVCMEVTRVSR